MKPSLLLKSTLIALLSGFLTLSYAQGQGQGKGHGKGHGNPHDEDNAGQPGGKHGPYFRDSDVGVLKQYYSGPTNLPPGLRKKYYRTGTLPPGWQKRFQPMPPQLVQQLPPIPAYCERGYIDGYAVVYNKQTRVIMDSIDIIGALAGR